MSSTTKCCFFFGALAFVVGTGAVAAGEGCGNDETVDSGVGGECCAAPDVCKDKSELDQCVMLDGEGTGYCLPKYPTFMECVPECPKPATACYLGCCYSTGKKNEFFCGPAGTQWSGDECSSANDCDCGAVCLDRNGGAFCWVVCTAADDCGAGTCTDTGLGFSVCVDEEPE